jgi:hypothetical protein
MDIAAITLWVFAFVIASFGVGFTGAGLANERAYWSQRDPHGDPRADATKLPSVLRHAFTYAVGEYRAPIRVAAIGVILLYLAALFAVVAIIVSVAGA